MKTKHLIIMSIVGSSAISTTPARHLNGSCHRWKCLHCGQISETEGNFPPANYNCNSSFEVHAWEQYDVVMENLPGD